MTTKQRLFWLWIKLFETSIIVSAICLFGIAGTGLGWYRDDGLVFIENPASGTAYVVHPRIHAGDEVIVHRSMKRTDDCGAHSSIIIVAASGAPSFPLQNYTSFAMPIDHFGTSLLGFMTPLRQAPGKYLVRTVVECQRNPLSTVTQKLIDLPFEIVPSDVPLEEPSNDH